MANFPKGSEWRRWDLHTHTPGTLKNDQYEGTNLNEKWEKYIVAINNHFTTSNDSNRVHLVGITDYLSIDNYFHFISLKKDLSKPLEVIPNVELRITPVTGSGTPINIHCLFNPAHDSSIQNRFFSKLFFDHCGRSFSASKEDLLELGKRLLQGTNFQTEDYIDKAREQFVPSHEALIKVFKEDPELRKNTIIILSNSSNDGASGCRHHYEICENISQLDATRRNLYYHTDAIFSSNQSDIDFFLGKKSLNTNQIVENYRSLKPCFHGSDAHSNEKVFNPDQNRFCWVKADLDFEGLKHVLTEPQERVYIGTVPEVLSRTMKNKTKYINELIITRKGIKDTEQVWFDNIKIPFNKELVAIIGNKGEGKSAIADIIGLCTDSENINTNASFLNEDKFNSHENKQGNRFNASVEWLSEDISPEISLDNKVQSGIIPKTKYIPQQYFDKLCNEIGQVNAFKKEIENVIFKYIPATERSNQASFSELINFKKSTISKEKNALKIEITKINKEIIKLEDQAHPDHKKNIESNLSEKKMILDAHIKNKPYEVRNPKLDVQQTQQTKEAEDLINLNNKLNIEFEETKTKLTNANEYLTALEQIKREIENKINDFNKFLDDNGKRYSHFELGLIEQKIQFDYSKLNKQISTIKEEIKEYSKEINFNPENTNTLIAKIKENESKIENINSKLSKETKEYTKYIANLNTWEDEKKKLVGDIGKLGSITYYENQLIYINTHITDDIKKLRDNRNSLSNAILEKYYEISNIYDEIKRNIAPKISQIKSIISSQNNNMISIDSELQPEHLFAEKVMTYINQNVKGSFRITKDGLKLFRDKILNETKWKDSKSVLNMLDKVIYFLENDITKNNEKRHIQDQVTNRLDFYNFLFSMDYLKNTYDLKYEGKSLNALSSGEKGALLLIFYLALDEDNIPLIIDQPEDNLDNYSVSKILVPYIKNAKKNRQIIIVTHNPNLAIVADAEQIIRCYIDKNNGNTFSFISGSIENKNINQEIVNVLEGTMPAFIARKTKYKEQ